MLGHGQSVSHMRAYWKSDIHTMIYNNFGPVAPDIVEQVVHNSYGLIPHQCIISLNNHVQPSWAKNWSRFSKRTSENAGATIFRIFFQSSPSEATIFIPKMDNAT
jgi:hypothetical protein